jgi:hypothetical protein
MNAQEVIQAVQGRLLEVEERLMKAGLRGELQELVTDSLTDLSLLGVSKRDDDGHDYIVPIGESEAFDSGLAALPPEPVTEDDHTVYGTFDHAFGRYRVGGDPSPLLGVIPE